MDSGFKYVFVSMESHMEANMGNPMQTGVMWRLIGK